MSNLSQQKPHDSEMKNVSNETKSMRTDSPIIYIMVIGFHHKLGCQLEFCYPNNKLILKNSSSGCSGDIDLYTLPKKWAHLPSLALPDGSHNYNSDYAYFHLEDEETDIQIETSTDEKKKSTKSKPNRTLFGISCYRQINASEVLNKESNVTRNTLQKSVCILSTCPLYGTSIRLKLHSITCAYFDQKDFRRTDLLVDAFNTTFRNSSALSDYSINYKKCTDENLIGLSLSDLVVRYQHKILILFKLILLQKKCLFQLKPVSNLSNTIISLVSLIPDIFKSDVNSNNGLEYCSGFFDSIDLVNCELERKATVKSQRLVSTRTPNDKPNKKVKQKRMLSFSNKKAKLTGSMSSSSSPMSSTSSSPVTTQDLPKPVDNSCVNTYDSNFLNDRDDDHGETGVDVLDWSANENKDMVLKSTSSLAKFTSTPTEINRKNRRKTPSKLKSHTQNSQSYLHSSPHGINDTSLHSVEPKFQLEQLLSIDFGMPFNLFSEFNILHPYLSLYYLDYFTMINKMNTKLYCTTSLMLSMMSAANVDPIKETDDKKNQDSIANSNSISSASGTSSFTNVHRPGKIGGKEASASLPIGYTIGATNALFKQRLYDDIDVFVDETNIDVKQNEVLKKQLQLSTADLRFADYLIKNVTGNRNMQQKAMSQNTPTLLSVKKASSNSFCEVDENSIDSSILSSANWEGSDEWIRLNFKWYFYSLLGSMIKEELCEETRCKTEILMNQIATLESYQQANFSSNSSSTISLDNDVIDIHDYIESASIKSSVKSSKNNLAHSNSKHTKLSSHSLNPSNDKQASKKQSKSSKNYINNSQYSLNPSSKSGSVLAMAREYLQSTSTSHTSYNDDYNAVYLSEFRSTICFQEWAKVNRSNLETKLFQMTETDSISESNEMITQFDQLDLKFNQDDLKNLHSKLQCSINKLQHLESTKLSHPFSGTMSVHDIKLRFNFMFTTTDSGKKINKALVEGSKIVNTTSRAVGDALSQAKSSFSSFLSNWSTTSTPNTSVRSSANGKSNKSLNTNKIEENQKFTNL